jgi:hypothetical protein
MKYVFNAFTSISYFIDYFSYQIDINIVFLKKTKINKPKIKIESKMDKVLKCKTRKIRDRDKMELLGG